MTQTRDSSITPEVSTDPVVRDGGRALRDDLGHFTSGVLIVTGAVGGQPVSLTCQSFSSLSINPPIVMFCPSKASTSRQPIRTSGACCINALAGASSS
ncbi:flavin reductase family protein [Rhodococcus sp. W8901]|uniref:flavin reductase family protein n=1 Tax=Rhodococcus sp. W8901 TaxID=2742603 RepID=UPI00158396AE|nr:flavin reductase family protein [Rhodococcus sp. W8901]